MTKSFEVSIAIILLLSFVFFVFEIRTLDYNNIEAPEYVKNIILNNVKDTQFRELVNNKDSDNIYQLLYNDIDQKYTIKVCDYILDDCVIKDIGNYKNKSTISYYFIDINKTLYILFY
ncbi:MAG TPA: hypothetical protein PK685_02370 [archaeon]|jgi:hypothetical protein|nr:hypothetical protein [archaeon]